MNGEPRKEHHKGKWEQVVQKATRSLQEMLRAASQRRRNVIIDQVRGLSSGVLTFCMTNIHETSKYQYFWKAMLSKPFRYPIFLYLIKRAWSRLYEKK